jgi:hypothetical protein
MSVETPIDHTSDYLQFVSSDAKWYGIFPDGKIFFVESQTIFDAVIDMFNAAENLWPPDFDGGMDPKDAFILAWKSSLLISRYEGREDLSYVDTVPADYTSSDLIYEDTPCNFMTHALQTFLFFIFKQVTLLEQYEEYKNLLFKALLFIESETVNIRHLIFLYKFYIVGPVCQTELNLWVVWYITRPDRKKTKFSLEIKYMKEYRQMTKEIRDRHIARRTGIKHKQMPKPSIPDYGTLALRLQELNVLDYWKEDSLDTIEQVS